MPMWVCAHGHLSVVGATASITKYQTMMPGIYDMQHKLHVTVRKYAKCVPIHTSLLLSGYIKIYEINEKI